MKKGDAIAWAMAACLALAAAAAAAQDGEEAAAPSPELKLRMAEADADPALAQRLLQLGRGVAVACAHCHGAHGITVRPDVPNLAAQNRAYLLEQMQQFADGRRRDPTMEGVIQALSVDEMVGAVLFFSSVRRGPPLGGWRSAAAAAAGRPPGPGTSTAAVR